MVQLNCVCPRPRSPGDKSCLCFLECLIMLSLSKIICIKNGKKSLLENHSEQRNLQSLACRSWCRSDAFTMVVKLGASGWFDDDTVTGQMDQMIYCTKWRRVIYHVKCMSYMNSSKSQIFYQLAHDFVHLFKVTWKRKSVKSL